MLDSYRSQGISAVNQKTRWNKPKDTPVLVHILLHMKRTPIFLCDGQFFLNFEFWNASKKCWKFWFHLQRVHYVFTNNSKAFLLYIPNQRKLYRGADRSLAWPTSRWILFDGQNISFDISLVIYINSTNIPPYNIARCSVWVWNLVADTEGPT